MRNRGFSIAALIIAVIIIGALATIVWLKWTCPSHGHPKINICGSDITSIGCALERYNAENGFFPTTAQGIDALLEKPTTSPVPQYWDKYLKKSPKDPWGNPYQYCHPSTHGKEYDVWSMGLDGKDGTDDDIVSWEE